MSPTLIHFFLLGGAFLVLFAIGELLFHKFKVKVELTRKLVHFGTGFLTLLFPILLDNAWYVLALCAAFAVILFTSLRYDLLKSINKIDRYSHGSIAYPVAVFLTYVYYAWEGEVLYPQNPTSRYLLFYLPILLLAVCDPVAALCGKRWPFGKYKVGNGHKTIMGSACFFIAAVIVTTTMCFLLVDTTFARALLFAVPVALFVTLAEAASRDGLDNLYIPLATVIIFQLLEGRMSLLYP